MVNNQKHKRALSTILGLPAELLPGVPRVMLRGNDEASIENHGGLHSYARDCVELKCRNGFLRIRGDDLELAAMRAEELVVRGFIVSVELY